MFFSNIVKKAFGFIREIVLASVFGSSIIYSNFILLKTVSDLFSQLSQGSALQASLLSKFSKIYIKGNDISLINVLSFSKTAAFRIFLISQALQLPIVFYINPENYCLFIFLSLVLGLLVSTNFFSSIFLLIIQGKGHFKKHSIATTIDMFISTVLIYPFSIFFGVLGIALSRMFGLFILVYKYLRPIFNELQGERVKFNFNDINLSIMFLGNFANIIMLLSRFVAGLDDGNNIAFYNYAVVLLNALLTAVVLNLNTIVLRRLSIKKEVKLILFSVFSAFFLGLGLVFIINLYGLDIFKLLFERGAFTEDDTLATYYYAKDLSKSFIFIFIASALFQPFFSMDQVLIKKTSKVMVIILLTSILILFSGFIFFDNTARQNSLIMIYVLSIESVLLAAYSSFKYFRTKTN